MTQTNFCPHCQARQEKPGRCDPCRDLKTTLARARKHYERRRHLHTVHDWPPGLNVTYQVCSACAAAAHTEHVAEARRMLPILETLLQEVFAKRKGGKNT
jgi:hypothetical protein